MTKLMKRSSTRQKFLFIAVLGLWGLFAESTGGAWANEFGAAAFCGL
jgi:hypothetical protein